jgi:hypothetical protein
MEPVIVRSSGSFRNEVRTLGSEIRIDETPGD